MCQARRHQSERGRSEADSGHALRTTAMVTVTIRMPVAMVEALKREAERQQVRGYQTLLKQWIEDRLAGDHVIPAQRLKPVLRRLQETEGALQRLMVEATPDH